LPCKNKVITHDEDGKEIVQEKAEKPDFDTSSVESVYNHLHKTMKSKDYCKFEATVSYLEEDPDNNWIGDIKERDEAHNLESVNLSHEDLENVK